MSAQLPPRESYNPTASLVMNVFPAVFTAETASVLVGRWEGAEHAQALREQTPGLCTWCDRDDGNRMFAWHPEETGVSIEGMAAVTVRPEKDPKLFERLLRDGVDRRLKTLGFRNAGRYGYINEDTGNLLETLPALTAAAGNPEIGLYPRVVIQVLFTRDARGAFRFGLIVDVHYTTRFDVTAAEWLAAGLGSELRAGYVVLRPGTEEAERFPHLARCAIGQVDTIADGRCTLVHPREPKLAEVALTSICPERKFENLQRYLAARDEHAFYDHEQLLLDSLRDRVRPQYRHHLAWKLVFKRLHEPGVPETATIPLLPDLEVRFQDMAQAQRQTFPVRRYTRPRFSFDAAGMKYPDRPNLRRIDDCLKEFGPYDQQNRRLHRPRILVVAPEVHRGKVARALGKLRDGIVLPRKKSAFFGMRLMYRWQDPAVEYAWVPAGESSEMHRYARTLQEAFRAADRTGDGGSYDLVITVIEARYRELPDSENPYYQTKALTLSQEGIPTQAVYIETLEQDDYNLQYSFNNLALAVYAKCGGTAYVLDPPTEESAPTTELVFGIGRGIIRAHRFAEAEETVGFATVFRGNGEYLYNDATPYCDKTCYEDAFEETIRRSILRVAEMEMLKDGAPLRLVFHVPRRPGQYEVAAILNAVRKVPQFDIKFALLHINDDHALRLYDRQQTRPVAYGRRAVPAAKLLPSRGVSVALGPRERLVTFIGPEQYRGFGTPTPMRVTLHQESTYKDLDTLVEQLYQLSFMSTRSMNPGTRPVTLAYADNLAHLTGRLRRVQHWTVELIHEKLGHRLWFI